MNPLEFLFQLLAKYVPMPDSKLKRLQLDGFNWYAALGEGEASHPLLAKFKFFAEQWYIQLLMGVLFIWTDKELHQYINAPKVDDDDDDEEEDDRRRSR